MWVSVVACATRARTLDGVWEVLGRSIGYIVGDTKTAMSRADVGSYRKEGC